MPTLLATAIFICLIILLFVLDRARDEKVSVALWIPTIWISLASSRMVSQWMGVATAVESSAQAAEGNALDRNILMALIAAGMLVLARRGKSVRALLRSNAPILIFLSYCAVSVIWSDYPGVAFKRWTKAVGELVMILIVLTELDPSAAIMRLLTRIGFLLVPTSVLFIKYHPALGRVYGGMAVSHVSYTGVTLDKNMLGVLCLMAGLNCVAQFIGAYRQAAEKRQVRRLLAQAVVFALVLWLFRIANSMTPLACFILGSAMIAATSFPGLAGRRATPHLMALGILAVVVTGLFLDLGADLVNTMGRNQDLTGRTGLWRDLLRINENPILGTGFESFWLGVRLEKLWAIYWWRPNEAHNGYLEMFLNLGAVGSSLFGVFVIAGYLKAVKAFRTDPRAGGLILALFVVGLAYSFTEAGFRVMHPVWVMFMLAAVADPRLPAAAAARPSPAHGRGGRFLGVAGGLTPYRPPARPAARPGVGIAGRAR